MSENPFFVEENREETYEEQYAKASEAIRERLDLITEPAMGFEDRNATYTHEERIQLTRKFILTFNQTYRRSFDEATAEKMTITQINKLIDKQSQNKEQK